MGVFAWMGKKGMGGGRTSKLTSIQEAREGGGGEAIAHSQVTSQRGERGEGCHCAQPSHIEGGGEGYKRLEGKGNPRRAHPQHGN